MKAHYPLIVAATDKGYESVLTRLCRDPENRYYGALDDMTYLTEPGSACGVVGLAASVFSCPDSKYYRDPAVLPVINDACDMILRASHEDGTLDFLATNFYTPATFEIQAFMRGYKNFRKLTDLSEAEKASDQKMLSAITSLARGCLNGGFHTPNHRWVECAAMLMCYNILGWPELMKKVRGYLSEGIDCDAYGEFTERSMGCYNAINVNSMMVMAEEGHMPELYEYAKKNLDLTFQYLDADGTLFTRNSRRQDKNTERFYPAHGWYYLYLWAGYVFDNPKYLKFAKDMFESSVTSGRGVPGCLWLYMDKPALKTLEPDVAGAVISESYHAYYPNSNILRVRKGDFSYTLVANQPDFLHIKYGRATMTVRMCASFFAVAQFEPKKLEKTETGYRMTFSGHGEYKGLFPEPPKSPDWDSMDHSLRPVIHPCELDYVLNVTDTEDGLRMRIEVGNTPHVPFKLEFVIQAGTRLETNEMIMDTTAGGTIAVKSGSVRLENVETGAEVTIRGLFAEHMYHKTMRGSVPQDTASFSLYATGYSPIDREIAFVFSKRAHARAMRERV